MRKFLGRGNTKCDRLPFLENDSLSCHLRGFIHSSIGQRSTCYLHSTWRVIKMNATMTLPPALVTLDAHKQGKNSPGEGAKVPWERVPTPSNRRRHTTWMKVRTIRLTTRQPFLDILEKTRHRHGWGAAQRWQGWVGETPPKRQRLGGVGVLG